MLKRVATFLAVFTFALAILTVSVLRSAAVRYAFSQSPSPTPTAMDDQSEIEINYQLAYPGRVLPDHPAWPLKAVRDKIWSMIVIDPLKKADLYLLFADKRIGAALLMFERDKSELGVSVLTKAEKYLELAQAQGAIARQKGDNTRDFYTNLAISSLKHRQMMEDILNIAPEDAKPVVIETVNYPTRVFQAAKTALGEMGVVAPDNPFESKN